jgi:hypothetical protein
MTELEYHTQDAILFAQENEETVDARAVLISAWNECVDASHLPRLATFSISPCHLCTVRDVLMRAVQERRRPLGDPKPHERYAKDGGDTARHQQYQN